MPIDQLRSDVHGLIAAGHGHDQLTCTADGHLGAVAAPRLGRIEKLKARVGRFALFSWCSWAIRANNHVREVKRQRGDLGALANLHVQLDAHYGAHVMDRAAFRTPLAQRLDAVVGPEDAARLLGNAEAARTETMQHNRVRVDAMVSDAAGPMAQAMRQFGKETWPWQGHCVATVEFLQALVRRFAEEHPAFAREPLTDAQVGELCQHAALAYAEFHGALGNEGTEAVFARLPAEKRATTPSDQLLMHARAGVLQHEFEKMLSNDTESVLWQAVEEESRNNEDVTLDSGTTRLVESLGRKLKDAFSPGALFLPDQLGVRAGMRISTLLDTCREQLVKRVQSSVREHFAAIKLIQQDISLSQPQRKMLLEMARTQRLDPTLVRSMVRVGRAAADLTGKIVGSVEGGDAAAAFRHLNALRDVFDDAYRDIVRKADELWLSPEFAGPERRSQIFGDCLRLGLAGEATNDRIARHWFDTIARLDPDATPAVHQLMQACVQSPLQRVNELQGRLMELVDALAQRAGVDLEGVAEQRTMTVRKAAGAVEETYGMTFGEKIIEQMTGDELKLGQLPPALQDLVAWQPQAGEGSRIGPNGAVQDSPHEDWVDPGFDVQTLVHADRILETQSLPPSPVFPPGLASSLPYAKLFVDGVEVDDDQLAKAAALRAAMGGKGDQSDALLEALSRCLNLYTAQLWHERVQKEAFGRAGVTVHPEGGELGLEFHLDRQEQGGWGVSLRERWSPDKATSVRGEQPIAAGGLVMTGVTWYLAPPAREGQAPNLTRIGARAVFAF